MTAYRNGLRDLHSYLVGVTAKKTAAILAANDEEMWRGGKYICEIVEWPLDKVLSPSTRECGRAIKRLPLVDLTSKFNQGKS